MSPYRLSELLRAAVKSLYHYLEAADALDEFGDSRVDAAGETFLLLAL